MEVKKSPKANLEDKKSTGLLIGYVMVLAVIFAAFEWTQRDKKIDTSGQVAEVVFEEEIEIPITEQPEQVQAPPPPEAPSIAETLTIVDDDSDVQQSAILSSEETGEQVEIKYTPTVAVQEEEEDVVDEQEIFEIVEEPTTFPGGDAALMQWLSKNIKYPAIAQENGTQGRVTVRFVVERDGSVSNAEVVRGVDPYLDKEALRVVNSMPKWNPGKQRGKAVRTRFTLPVTFRLQ
ncbi:MAG: energy transducer TonB [Bacteroidaceae bacterium]|nr:energy transducer TonB [Bacteroidaceae bacterium]MBQ9883100.1 energy transducer TonB [Bacteroidaceae bacterium]MBR3014853.1 energy transducer TonB [Bacteroidaceae bacterium]